MRFHAFWYIHNTGDITEISKDIDVLSTNRDFLVTYIMLLLLTLTVAVHIQHSVCRCAGADKLNSVGIFTFSWISDNPINIISIAFYDQEGMGKTTYPFPDFNSCTNEVGERISNFIPQFIIDVITQHIIKYAYHLLVSLLSGTGTVVFMHLIRRELFWCRISLQNSNGLNPYLLWAIFSQLSNYLEFFTHHNSDALCALCKISECLAK